MAGARIIAIGDVQGCHTELLTLLEQLNFSPDTDILWLTGDIVNRGPNSLETLRFVKDLGDAAVTVLGNHDLHLLAHAYGHGKLSPKDTLQDILQAADRDELLDWLRHQPVLHHDQENNLLLCHAGIYPSWDLQTATENARELESRLRGNDPESFFAHMYGNMPDRWEESLEGMDRLRFITNCFTRMRYCTPDGQIELKHKGTPGSQPSPFVPWFDVPSRKLSSTGIVFGHWSTLGEVTNQHIYALDTGCLWGGCLTAMVIDEPGTRSFHSLDCQQAVTPT